MTNQLKQMTDFKIIISKGGGGGGGGLREKERVERERFLETTGKRGDAETQPSKEGRMVEAIEIILILTVSSRVCL